MRIKPVLFNTPMVRALLTGQKTATRRLVKPVPPPNARLEFVGDMRHAMDLAIEIPGPDDHRIYTPPYLPGDILYVREAWAKDGKSFTYRADAANRGSAAYYLEHKAGDTYNRGIRWHPSIHMPKEAARIWLRVTDVRAERLRDITEEGAVKEGLYKGWRLHGKGSMALTARQAFMWLWIWMEQKQKMPAKYTWACNPWVWVIEFERCEKPEDI